MSEHDVNIPIKATDEASAVFKKAGENARAEMTKVSEAQVKRNSSRVDANWDQAAFAKFLQDEKAAIAAEAERAKVTRDAAKASEQATLAIQLEGKALAEKEAKEIAAASKQAARSRSTAAQGGALDSLNESFGRASMAGKLLKIAAGGGAVFALGRAAKMVETLTGKYLELSNAVKAGGMSGREAAGELARELPIVGDLAKAIDHIREAAGGDGGAARMMEEAKATEAAAKAQIDLARISKQEFEDAFQAVRRINAEIGRIGLTGSAATSAIAADAKTEADYRVDQEAKKKKAEIDNNKDLLDAREALQAELKEKIPDVDFNAFTAKNNKEEIESALGHQSQANNDYARLTKAATDAKKQIDADAANEKMYNARLFLKQDSQARFEEGKKLAEDARQQEAELAKDDAENRVNAARLAGQATEPELEEIEVQRQQKIADIRAKLKKDTEEGQTSGIDNPTFYDDMAARAKQAELNANNKAAIDAANVRRKAADANAQHENETQKLAAQARIDALKAEAAHGNQLADIEAKRLEIAEKYREKREEINKLLRDDSGLSAADKAKLRATLGGLGSAEEREKMNIKPAGGEGSYKAPTLTESRTATGAGRAITEQREIEYARSQAQALKAAQDTAKALEDLPDFLAALLAWIDGAGVDVPELFGSTPYANA